MSFRSILWTSLKEGRKVIGIYFDFIKDVIFLFIILKALGGISALQDQWTFATAVSTYSNSRKLAGAFFKYLPLLHKLLYFVKLSKAR